MNKGCVAYFCEGLKTAKNTFFKNKKNFLKYYLFSMASFLGSIFIVTMPIFFLAEVRMARIAKEKNDIAIFDSLEGADHPKRWWTLLLTNYLWILLVMAGVLVIVLCFVPTVPFISSLATLESPILMLVFAYLVIFALYVVLIVYMILATLHFAPVNYIIDKDESLGVSEVLKTSYSSMNKDGKVTYFLINILYGLVSGVFVFFLTILLIIMLALGQNIPAVGFIFLAIFLGIVILALILFLPFLMLGQSVSNISLFDDIIEFGNQESEALPVDDNNNPSNDQDVVAAVSDESTDRELSTDELLDSLFKEEE